MRPFDELNEEEVQELVDRAKLLPPPESQPEKCDRLTAQLAFRHESCGQTPTAVGVVFSTALKNKEQPYHRTGIRLTEQPSKLDLGWLSSVSYLVIENKLSLPSHPTKEQREDYLKHRVLVLVKDVPIFSIAPGQIFAVELVSKETTDHVSIVSSGGDCPVNVTAFPS